jgi:hypothetical protein
MPSAYALLAVKPRTIIAAKLSVKRDKILFMTITLFFLKSGWCLIFFAPGKTICRELESPYSKHVACSISTHSQAFL